MFRKMHLIFIAIFIIFSLAMCSSKQIQPEEPKAETVQLGESRPSVDEFTLTYRLGDTVQLVGDERHVGVVISDPIKYKGLEYYWIVMIMLDNRGRLRNGRFFTQVVQGKLLIPVKPKSTDKK